MGSKFIRQRWGFWPQRAR